jgi:two-component system phosphate regulon sensor histidine kinase PhoR
MGIAGFVGTYVWLVLDGLRGARLLNWLRTERRGDLVLGAGLWAEVSDRTRKLLRSHERATQESEKRLQDFLSALQASPNGVVLLDAEMRIEWCNQTAAAHFGLDVVRDMQQHLANLVRDPGFAAYLSGQDFSRDVVMPGKSHSAAKPVQLSVHRHPYGEGRSLLLSRDITALEQAEAMRRDFVANVSHEIRTPLTVLAGFVETLQTLPLDGQERQRYLDLMAQQAQRMQTLVNDLLMLSRLEGSPIPSMQECVSVDVLFAQCRHEAGELARLIWGKSRQLDFENEAGWEIVGARQEIYSAMSNLINNAVRYTPVDKEIGVSWVLRADGGAAFSVRDAGPGIAPEHIPRLTERFYRVDRSRSRDTGGTGLGLAIVKHVVQRHGAELHIESVPGQGSVFSITFSPARVRRAAL